MATNNGNHVLIREYLNKHGIHPGGTRTISNKALSELIYKEHEARFSSAESVRKAIQILVGKSGEHMRISQNTANFETEKRTTSPLLIPMPEPESDDMVPVEIQWNDFIVIADIHLPNHRMAPIECAIEYAKEKGIKKLLLNGDLLDNTPFTRWTREPVSGQDVKRWFDQAIQLLEYLKQHFDEIIWLEGNHDFWYTRWLMSKVELLYGDPYYSLTHRLQLDRLNIQFYDQKYLLKAGKLYISHGHVMLKGGGVHAAARLLNKSGQSHLMSHVHRVQTFTKTDISGKIHAGYTTGCMCTLAPEYQPYGGDSQHGFAHVSVKPNRDFTVRNYLIYNGEIQ